VADHLAIGWLKIQEFSIGSRVFEVSGCESEKGKVIIACGVRKNEEERMIIDKH
jgi:hypothetical protein